MPKTPERKSLRDIIAAGAKPPLTGTLSGMRIKYAGDLLGISLDEKKVDAKDSAPKNEDTATKKEPAPALKDAEKEKQEKAPEKKPGEAAKK